MNKKAILTALLISIFLGVNSSFAFYSTTANEVKQVIKNNSKQKGYSLFVPSGTICNAILATDINSENAFLGQNINAILIQDFKYQDSVIASKDSIIKGTVITNKKNRNTPDELQIKFTTILTPYNNIIPINASIFTNNSDSVLKSENEENQNILIKSNTPIDIIFNQPITLGVQ